MITKLSTDIAQQLKAEQYIHNTYVIVKELVENSIDSNATVIYVKILKDQIIVEDNGSGISRASVENLGEFGCTSKYETSKGVIGITNKVHKTYGYRGQALFSLSKMAQVVVKSSTKDDEIAFSKDLTNKKVSTVAREIGTTVIASKLFETYPVRKKLNENGYKRNITQVGEFLEAMKVVFNGIFVMKYEDKNKIKEVIFDGRKADLKEYLIDNFDKDMLVHTSTYFDLYFFPTAIKLFTLVFSCKRLVKSHLKKLVEKHVATHIKNKASYILILKDDVDINLSNDKSEIILRNKIKIENELVEQIQKFMSESKFVENGVPDKIKTTSILDEDTFCFKRKKVHDEEVAVESEKQWFKKEGVILKSVTNKHIKTSAAKAHVEKVPEEEISTLVVNEENIVNAEIPLTVNNFNNVNIVKNESILNDENKENDSASVDYATKRPNRQPLVEKPLKKEEVQQIVSEEPKPKKLQLLVNKEDFKTCEVLGQFNHGFILCKMHKNNKKYLLLVDQHAADEIKNYEKLRIEMDINRQTMLKPIELNLNNFEELIVKDNIDVFNKNGFSCEVVGNKMCLTGIPDYKNICFDASDFYNLLKKVINEDADLICDKFKHIMASKACRHSIMIGTCLEKKDFVRVVRNLADLKMPWNCPHGRPTFIILKEME